MCVIVPNFVAISQTSVQILQFIAIFKMAAVCHFAFYEFKILSADRCSGSMCAIMPWRLVKPLLRYSSLLIFQDGSHPPSWICYTCVWITHKEYLVVFIAVQNLVGLGAVVWIMCQF